MDRSAGDVARRRNLSSLRTKGVVAGGSDEEQTREHCHAGESLDQPVARARLGVPRFENAANSGELPRLERAIGPASDINGAPQRRPLVANGCAQSFGGGAEIGSAFMFLHARR